MDNSTEIMGFDSSVVYIWVKDFTSDSPKFYFFQKTLAAQKKVYYHAYLQKSELISTEVEFLLAIPKPPLLLILKRPSLWNKCMQ